jgi:hypothetical protein
MVVVVPGQLELYTQLLYQAAAWHFITRRAAFLSFGSRAPPFLLLVRHPHSLRSWPLILDGFCLPNELNSWTPFRPVAARHFVLVFVKGKLCCDCNALRPVCDHRRLRGGVGPTNSWARTIATRWQRCSCIHFTAASAFLSDGGLLALSSPEQRFLRLGTLRSSVGTSRHEDIKSMKLPGRRPLAKLRTAPPQHLTISP